MLGPFSDRAVFDNAGWNVKQLRYVTHVVMDAFYTFLADDGWAISSHIALSTLMALFPFLIVLTSLAGFFDQAVLQQTAGDVGDGRRRQPRYARQLDAGE